MSRRHSSTSLQANEPYPHPIERLSGGSRHADSAKLRVKRKNAAIRDHASGARSANRHHMPRSAKHLRRPRNPPDFATIATTRQGALEGPQKVFGDPQPPHYFQKH